MAGKCWTFDHEFTGLNLAGSYCVLMLTQHSVPLLIINEYQLMVQRKHAYHMMC